MTSWVDIRKCEYALLSMHASSRSLLIVMLATDPLGAGLIHSLAKPGGNITGVATLESELGAKRLEHFHEAFPTATRVAVLYDPMTSATVLNEMEDGARRLKLELQVLEVRAPEDMDGAFMKATQWRAAALSVRHHHSSERSVSESRSSRFSIACPRWSLTGRTSRQEPFSPTGPTSEI